MRIIHSLEGFSWSGGQQQTLFLAVGQSKVGHDVLLLCQKGSELEKRAEKAGLKIRPHDYRREIHPSSLFGLLKVFDDFRPDVVNVHRAWAHTQWIFVSLMKRFKGLIVTRRVLFKPDFNPLSLVKYRSPAVRGYIAVSEAVKSRLEAMRISSRKIKVVYPATDTNFFDPEKPLEGDSEIPWNTQSPTILFVGGYHPNKGHHLVLDAYQKLRKDFPDLQLVFAGTGTDSENFRKSIPQNLLNNRVFLLGFRSDVPRLFANSTVSVNASFEEGFPGTVRESIAMGVPVVASDIPANREIAAIAPIKLFAAGSSLDLAAKLSETLLNLPNRIEKMELRKRAIEAFSVDSMVTHTLEAYLDFERGCR